MKKVIAFNASPRSNASTALMLKKALEGAAAQGAKTELVDLYKVNFMGCQSCMACKYGPMKAKGVCVQNDGLTQYLKKAREADVVLLGTPMYFWCPTGVARMFIERFLYPFHIYEQPTSNACPKKINTGLIFSYGAPKEKADERGMPKLMTDLQALFKKETGGLCKILPCYATVGKFVPPVMSPQDRKQMVDCIVRNHSIQAYNLGKELVGK